MKVHPLSTASALVGVAFAAGILLTGSRSSADEPATRVILNGRPTPVFFNDGDSFRVLKGKFKGGKARLFGYNTLESYGPVHQWGSWTASEMYHIAKMAALHARAGTWKCETDGKTDTYGRMLINCFGLAEELIRMGYAHAMSVTDDPANAKLLEAQHEAMKARRGIWAHGIPEFVLTSLHSAEEDVNDHGTYNRLVSSDDGHSIKWKHDDEYNECQNVCIPEYPSDPSLLPKVIERLQSEGAAYLEGMSDEDINAVLGTYQRIRLVDRPVAKKYREPLGKLLDRYASEGLFGTAPGKPMACMRHIPFNRRFGGNRAACLKK
jgi:endonuclease YncB( thermonuclease family)